MYEEKVTKKWYQLKASILSAKWCRIQRVCSFGDGARNEMAPVQGVHSVSERV